ncbi:MAG: tRNA lysidine(34) synthetase TilS [Clostridia bacterium]|nr:tRNA lysidine(34) synthetase TilS [Clostridia bacterium]
MCTKTMYDKFVRCIEKYNMIDKSGVVVAVSGGADSTCLLDLSVKLGVPVYCAHVNHGIRDTAERDEEFVRGLCAEYGVKFFVKRLDIPQISKERKISEELCGREERYKFFFEILQKTNSSAIFTAHNKNDSAESVIFHLARGSGANGLSGISPCRGDGVYRPLVGFTRNEIEAYLKENNIPWVEDETNQTDNYTRNFIRHNIIPGLENINHAVTDAIVKAGTIISADNAFLEKMALELNALKSENGKIIIDKKILTVAPEPLTRRVILKALSMAGIMPSFNDVTAVEELVSKQSGKKHIFPCQKTAQVVYDKIVIGDSVVVPDYEYELQCGGTTYIKETGLTVGLYDSAPEKPYIKIPDRAGSYIARKRRSGDRFTPKGMQGSKTVKKFFIDLKIDENERDCIPLIVNQGQIVSVGMLRAAEDTSKTKSVLYLKIQ